MSGGIKRYALVGTGGRASMFINPIASRFQDSARLVGLCDVNPRRMRYWNDRLEREHQHPRLPEYLAADFDKMIRETRPDAVLVTTVDAFHHQYIIRAMELGCDAITEKPMTIDDERCRAIFDAVQRTGKKLRVCFNYRFLPGAELLKKLISSGTIGEVIHVDFEYLLNTSHGADYFRRWHREKDKSGGLMVHKATHHFDLINWWLDAVPETVFGFGRLAFYGAENARQRGIEVKYDRYTGHDTTGDPFAMKLDEGKHAEEMKALYLEAEIHDGYRRDRNVFGSPITIEDSMSALVRYRTGAVLNYSLNAYLPREGFQAVFNGTKGRIDYFEAHASHIIAAQSDDELGEEQKWESYCTVQPLFGKPYKVEIPKARGGHGGADPQLQEQIFSNTPPADTLGRYAQHGQGAASILVGIAANQSFRTGQAVHVRDLCPQLGDAAHLSELP